MFVMNLIFRLPSFFSSDELNFLISVTNWGQMFDWKTWFPNPAGTLLESLLETRHSQNLHLCILLRKERPAKKHSLPKNTRSYNKTLIWSWLFLGDCWTHVQCATLCVHCLAKAHFSDQWIYLPNCDTCLRVRCQNINPIHTFGLFLVAICSVREM